MCADPDGVTLPVGGSMPVPTAYFPLTNGTVHSWPVPQFWAYNASAVKAKQTKFVKDDLFGTVASCNNSLGAHATLSGRAETALHQLKSCFAGGTQCAYDSDSMKHDDMVWGCEQGRAWRSRA